MGCITVNMWSAVREIQFYILYAPRQLSTSSSRYLMTQRTMCACKSIGLGGLVISKLTCNTYTLNVSATKLYVDVPDEGTAILYDVNPFTTQAQPPPATYSIQQPLDTSHVCADEGGAASHTATDGSRESGTPAVCSSV